MISIHAVDAPPLPRLVAPSLTDRWRVRPAVVRTGSLLHTGSGLGGIAPDVLAAPW